MRNGNPLGIPVELENDEISNLFDLDVCAILALEVLRLAETFDSIWKCHADIAAVYGHHRAFVGRAHLEHCFERIPGVFLKLLVTEAHAAVRLVELENDHVDLIANITELRWVLDLLFPAQV